MGRYGKEGDQQEGEKMMINQGEKEEEEDEASRRFSVVEKVLVMESSYRESCREGYYPTERDEGRQQVPHYPHQLSYHPTSLHQTPLVLEQADMQQRTREDFTANPAMLRSIYAGSGSMLPSPNVLLQSTSHFSSNTQPPQPHIQPQHQVSSNRHQPSSRSHFNPSTSGLLSSSVHPDNPGVPQSHEVPQTTNPSRTLQSHPIQQIPDISRDSQCHIVQQRTESSRNQHVLGVHQRPETSQDSQTHDPQRTEHSSDTRVSSSKEPLELSTHVHHTVPKDKASVKPSDSILRPRHPNILPALQLKSILPPPRSRDKIQRRSSAQLPDFLSFKYLPNEKENIVGVVTKAEVPKGMEFGPYNGNFLDEEIGSTKESTWELCTGGKVFLYIDGKKKDELIWMSYIQCARNEEEQNLEACQYYGQIYFRTTKVVDPGAELKVFYSKEYSESVGFKTTLKDLVYNEDEEKFSCPSCESQFPTAKRMLRHIKFDHETNRDDDLRPVITWRIKCKTENSKMDGWIEDVPQRKVEKENVEAGSQDFSPGQFICTVCGKKFHTEGRLEAHAMFHEFREDLTCVLCGEKQRNSKALTKHMAKHELCPYKCRKCDKSYKTQKSLLRHNREAHSLGQKHTCRICNIVFVNKDECLNHEQTHEEGDDSYLMSDNVWKKKKYRKEPKTEPDQGMSAEPPGKVKDSIENPVKAAPKKRAPRGKTAPRGKAAPRSKPAPEEPKDMLGKTLTYYNRPRPYKCRHCPRRYRSRMAAYEHEKETHEGKGTYKCNLCPRVFMKESNFFQHYQCHEQNRLYRCTLCPRTFASDSALANHQGEHTGLKPFKCEICGKGFRIRKWVCAHKRRMHQTRELRFFCSVCNKGFTDKGPLQKHELRHKGIRPFVCMICGKGFGVKYVLEVHMQSVHSEEKKYACEICGKKFSLNQHYVSHMFKHRAQGEDIPGPSTIVDGQEV